MRYHNRNKRKGNVKFIAALVILGAFIGAMVYFSREVEPVRAEIVKEVQINPIQANSPGQ